MKPNYCKWVSSPITLIALNIIRLAIPALKLHSPTPSIDFTDSLFHFCLSTRLSMKLWVPKSFITLDHTFIDSLSCSSTFSPIHNHMTLPLSHHYPITALGQVQKFLYRKSTNRKGFSVEPVKKWQQNIQEKCCPLFSF